MPSQQEQDNNRKERVAQWLKAHPVEWKDLQEEFRLCLSNAEISLKAQGTKERDFYAGKCSGIEECLTIDSDPVIRKFYEES